MYHGISRYWLLLGLLPGLLFHTGCGESTSKPTPYPSTTGTVIVDPDPDTLDAPWFLAGPNAYSLSGTGDLTLSDMAIGNYLLTWGAVQDWASPAPVSASLTLTRDATIAFHGLYSEVSVTGTIIIDPEPDTLNAPWLLTGPADYSLSATGDMTLTDMDIGGYTLTWGAVADWTSPSPETAQQTLEYDTTLSFYGTYSGSTETGTITIDPNPDHLYAPWRLTGPGGFDESGTGDTTFVGAPAGGYVLTWGEIPTWELPSPAVSSSNLIAHGEVWITGTYMEGPLFAGLSFGGPSTFDIVTWNLEYFPASSSTVEYAAAALLALDVDVVCLQEITSETSFRQLVDMMDGWGGYRDDEYWGTQQLAYLWNTVTVTVTDGPYTIYGGDSNAFPRRPLVLECTVDGRDLVIVNNHFKCCGDNVIEEGDSNDEEYRRVRASNLLDSWIRSTHPNEAVIVIGDLNDKLTDTATANVFNVFLDSPSAYLFADMALALGGSSNWSYRHQSHIDHILLTNELFADFEQASSSVVTFSLEDYLDGGFGEYESNLSDHLPVGLSMELLE